MLEESRLAVALAHVNFQSRISPCYLQILKLAAHSVLLKLTTLRLGLPPEVYWLWLRPLWSKLPLLTNLTCHPNSQESQRHVMSITDIECLVSSVPQMRELHLPQVYLATPTALQPLLRLKHLTTLSVQTSFVMAAELLQVPAPTAAPLTTPKPARDSSGIPLIRTYNFIQDLPALTHLTAFWHRSSLFSLTNFFKFRNPLRSLTHLVLFVAPVLDMAFFDALRTALPNLTHLSLHFVSRSRYYARAPLASSARVANHPFRS